MTENSTYPYLYLAHDGWTLFILEKLDQIFTSFDVETEKKFPYFTLIDDFLTIMKTLYENFEVKNQVKAKDSAELTSIRSMVSYIEDHFA